jgi:hypothetical protein
MAASLRLLLISSPQLLDSTEEELLGGHPGLDMGEVAADRFAGE